jgi:hypothetical protein
VTGGADEKFRRSVVDNALRHAGAREKIAPVSTGAASQPSIDEWYYKVSPAHALPTKTDLVR